MMKKSANIEVLYTELPWEERFAAAKNDGFDYIEFWNWDDKDLPQVKKLLDKNSLAISTMSGDKAYSMCDPGRRKEYLAFIQKSLKAAASIECPTLVIHSNDLLPNGIAASTFEEYSDTVKICTMYDTLSKIAPWAEDAGITFVLEALNVITDHMGNFLRHTQTSAELVQLTGSPNMKILYDAYHMYLNEGRICETLTKYVDSIGYIHIADAPGRAEPGTGAINYRNVFKHLNAIGYDRVVGFELYPQNGTVNAVKAIMEACRDL